MEDAGDAARWLAAVLCGFLPRAVWPRLEGVFIPVHPASIASATLQALAGFAVGFPSFLIYAWRVANENTDIMLTAAARQSGSDVSSAMSVVGTMFSPIAFVFFTPAGWISTYLATAGLVRLVAAIVDEPFGDPILTGLHRLATRVATKRAAAASVARRAALEGAETPDKILTGAAAGIPEAVHVVVAARRKPGWEQGVLVVTAHEWFRIGRIFEEYHDGGLRTLYPLMRSPQSEVMRRAVRYRMPGEEEQSTEADAAALDAPEVVEIPLSEDPLESLMNPPKKPPA